MHAAVKKSTCVVMTRDVPDPRLRLRVRVEKFAHFFLSVKWLMLRSFFYKFIKGSFNNHVDKMRGVGGPKLGHFCPRTE